MTDPTDPDFPSAFAQAIQAFVTTLERAARENARTLVLRHAGQDPEFRKELIRALDAMPLEDIGPTYDAIFHPADIETPATVGDTANSGSTDADPGPDLPPDTMLEVLPGVLPPGIVIDGETLPPLRLVDGSYTPEEAADDLAIATDTRHLSDGWAWFDVAGVRINVGDRVALEVDRWDGATSTNIPKGAHGTVSGVMPGEFIEVEDWVSSISRPPVTATVPTADVRVIARPVPSATPPPYEPPRRKVRDNPQA